MCIFSGLQPHKDGINILEQLTLVFMKSEYRKLKICVYISFLKKVEKDPLEYGVPALLPIY